MSIAFIAASALVGVSPAVAAAAPPGTAPGGGKAPRRNGPERIKSDGCSK